MQDECEWGGLIVTAIIVFVVLILIAKFGKDVGLKILKLAKMPIVHLGWLKKYFSGNTGHSD